MHCSMYALRTSIYKIHKGTSVYTQMCLYILVCVYADVRLYIAKYLCALHCMCAAVYVYNHAIISRYGVPTISRLLKIKVFFCRISSLL